MLTFRDVSGVPDEYFAKYYRQAYASSCMNSLVCKRYWKIRAQFAETHGCLIVKNDAPFFSRSVFDFPRKENDAADLRAAFDGLDEYCQKNYVKPAFIGVTDEGRAFLANRYPFVEMEDGRNYRDYFYDRAEMGAFVGKKYAGQRNHIHQFEKNYPDHAYDVLKNEDKEEIYAFLSRWKREELVKKDGKAHREFALLVAFLEKEDLTPLRTGCVRVNGEICAIAIGEKADDQVIVHAEKALHAYRGVNVYMVREYAKRQTDATWIDREDDAGEAGLRTSKMQYHPVFLLRESFVTVKNELDGLTRIPTLKSARLTLTPIKKEDAEAYFRLCTDEERNLYWGYDYKTDLRGELTTDYFYRGAKRDFRERVCLNFAIRREGELVGETVMFEFDSKGACQIGVRILPEFAGNGYGEEAFERTVTYALYGLGMRTVLSSCYKKNIPSVRIHEKLFRRMGEDAEKYYYVREY